MTTTAERRAPARHSKQTSVAKALFWPVAVIIVVLAAFLRLWRISSAPGWEWDEGVYTYIARNLAQNGLLESKTEFLSQPEPYMYHPPFHFYVESWWFRMVGAGITEARIFAALCALVTLVLIMVLLRNVIGSYALLVGGVLAIDGWLVFSQRVSWIENSMITIGVVGLLLYQWALKSQKWWGFVLAALVVSQAAVYKYVGIVFVGAVVIHFLVTRTQKRNHLIMISTAVVAFSVFIAMMYWRFGDVLLNASLIQLKRSVGEQSSNGALSNVSDIVTPLVEQYRVFAATVLISVISGLVLVVRTVSMIRHRSVAEIEGFALLYSWALSALLFFVALRLWFPHYFMLALIPLYCYLGAELWSLSQRWSLSTRRPQTLRRLIAVGVGLLVLCNGFAFYARMIAPRNDSALQEVSEYIKTHIPIDAKVIADESVGVLIPQPYCNTWRGDTCEDVEYAVVYTSTTQKMPQDNHFPSLIASAKVLFEVNGFKEHIAVYHLANTANTR